MAPGPLTLRDWLGEELVPAADVAERIVDDSPQPRQYLGHHRTRSRPDNMERRKELLRQAEGIAKGGFDDDASRAEFDQIMAEIEAIDATLTASATKEDR